MKVQIEVLDDQLELLGRIQSLPKMIDDHIGAIPSAFPAWDNELNSIKQYVANMEFKCKKMIFDTCIVKDSLERVFGDTTLNSDKYKPDDWDY